MVDQLDDGRGDLFAVWAAAPGREPPE